MVQHKFLYRCNRSLRQREQWRSPSPGLELWNLSAIKNNKISERFSFQFRAEFFNAFNHTNFGDTGPNGGGIGTNVDSANYGQVTTAHDPRQIQFGGKLYF